MTVAQLRPDQVVRRRPFTSPHLVERDRSILTAMLEDLRSLVYSGAREIVPNKRISHSAHGLNRQVIVCKPERLLTLDEIFITGFFALRNPDVEIAELDRANREVVRRFPHYPGILSYSTWELSGNNWVNFIVTDDPDVAEQWRACPAHQSAVDRLAPVHYMNLRIHSGRLPGGLGGERGLVLYRTKYWDYGSPTVWHAVRELMPL